MNIHIVLEVDVLIIKMHLDGHGNFFTGCFLSYIMEKQRLARFSSVYVYIHALFNIIRMLFISHCFQIYKNTKIVIYFSFSNYFNRINIFSFFNQNTLSIPSNLFLL